ncbi:MAG: hypothetical protein JXR34_10760, partial [Bacteroidales bacterium]|nr:hypothetical protein [Bacteroidales bacterium]
MKIKISITFLFLLIVGSGFGQDFPSKGVPQLVNFSPSEYQNAGKIWDIESAPNGIIYMATDRGLLEYDGLDFTLLHGSKGITRSVLVVNDSTIFTGSDLDFGQWKRAKNGQFKYQSLFPFKDNVQDGIEEFWHIFQLKGSVALVSTFNIYLLTDGQLTKIQAPARIKHSYLQNESLFVFDEMNRLWKFEDFKFIPQSHLPNSRIPNFIGAFKSLNDLCFVTENQGVVSLKNNSVIEMESPLSEYLKGAKVFSFEPIGQNWIGIGTVLKGLIIADLNGNILHIINRFKGLQNNTVLSLYYAQNGKLWMGLDYGLSCLYLKNNFSYVFDYRGDFGTAYTSFLHDDDFYLGTNQGLYQCKWSDLNNNKEFFSFDLISKSEGQVWKIFGYQNDLFVGHDKGLFLLRNNTLIPMDTKVGIWDMVFFNGNLFVGTYNGVSIFKKKNGLWTFEKKLDSISGSCKQLAFDKAGNFWVNIPNFAIVKVKLNDELIPIQRDNVFDYDSSCSFLQLDVLTDSVLLFDDTKNTFYYFNSQRFIPFEGSALNVSLKNSLGCFNSSVSLDSFYNFFPVNNGFALHRKGDFFQNSLSAPIIKRVTAFSSDSSFSVSLHDYILFKNNNLRFVFVVPNSENVYYQYRLHDFEEWSPVTPKTFVEF